MLENAAKSSADTCRMQAGKAVDLRPKAGGKLRLLTLSDLDGRTAAAKRARSLAAALADELGGAITASQGAAVERAATLVALAEDVRSRRLAGDVKSVSLEDLVRVDAAADRALRRLGLKRTEAPPTMTIRDVLEAEHAARMAREEAEAAGDASEAADAVPAEPEAAA